MDAPRPPQNTASNGDGRGRHHSPTPLCMFLFLFKPRLPCDLFRKKKCVGVGVGWGRAGGARERGVATFFLFTRISTPDTPRRPPPLPKPSCSASAAGPGSSAGPGREVALRPPACLHLQPGLPAGSGAPPARPVPRAGPARRLHPHKSHQVCSHFTHAHTYPAPPLARSHFLLTPRPLRAPDPGGAPRNLKKKKKSLYLKKSFGAILMTYLKFAISPCVKKTFLCK